MAITKHVQHPKSSATTATTQSVTVPRLPSTGDLLYGEIAVNYRSGYETLSIKNSSNQIIPFPRNGQIIDATTTEGLIDGQIGIDMTNIEAYYIYNEQRSAWQPLSTNHVDDESGLDDVPAVKDPQFAYVSDTGLLYSSQYDSSTSSQTWSALATLNPDSKRLANSQEPKVIIDAFTSDRDYVLLPNTLVFNDTTNKLMQYGDRYTAPGGFITAELLYTYDPSKNVIYYKVNQDKTFRWNGSQMGEIRKPNTFSASGGAISVATDSLTKAVTVSSNIFSASTSTRAVVYKMPTGASANTSNTSYYSLIYGLSNTVNRSTGATTFGSGNTVASGSKYSFVEGIANTVSGQGTHAEGSATTASASYSHAQGVSAKTNTTASASCAAGSGTITNNVAEFACGRYNNSTAGERGTLFSVGYGTADGSRKNALEVRDDGLVYIYDSRGRQQCLQTLLGL